MRRNLQDLEEQEFDLVVVGGGITGACIARDAVLRGLKTALIERGDFASGASHNSLKVIHGGIRYVQHLDFRRIRESIRERRFWLKCAPHNAVPLTCVMPGYGAGTRGPVALGAGFAVYNLLAVDRNKGVPRSNWLPAASVSGRAQWFATNKLGRVDRITATAQWYDGQMSDPNRLVLGCLEDASQHGLILANYVSAQELMMKGAAAVGVHAIDERTGSDVAIKCKCVVNAAGPWIGRLLCGSMGLQEPLAWTRGLNVVTPKLFEHDYAVAFASNRESDSLVGKTKRLFFITPWRGKSIIGTSHLEFTGDTEDYSFNEDEIDGLLTEVQEALPGLQLSRSDIDYVYGGLTPAALPSEGGPVGRERSAKVIDHERVNGTQGLISVVSIKYTTARSLAEKCVDLIVAKSGKRTLPCETHTRVLPGGEHFTTRGSILEALQQALPRVSADTVADLAISYGSGAEAMVARLMDGTKTQGIETEDLLEAWSAFSARQEMALDLADFLQRRTTIAETGRITGEIVGRCAKGMARELSWSANEEKKQIGELLGELRRHNAKWGQFAV